MQTYVLGIATLGVFGPFKVKKKKIKGLKRGAEKGVNFLSSKK